MKKTLSMLLAFLLLLAMLPPVSVAAGTIEANKNSPTSHAINTTISQSWGHADIAGEGDAVRYYYKFTMPEDGYAVFDLQYTGNSGGSIAVSFYLDGPGGPFAYIGTGDDATDQVKTLLQAGEYVYRLSADEIGKNYPEYSKSCQVTWHYQLSKNDASYTHTATDKEPNDNWSTAISLAPNTTAYGMIGAPDPTESLVFDSYDIYKLSLSSRSEVTLEGMGIDDGIYAWITEKDDDAWRGNSFNTKEAGNRATKTYTLEPGDYRIAVHYSLAGMRATPYQIKYTVKSLSGGDVTSPTTPDTTTPTTPGTGTGTTAGIVKTGTYTNSDYSSSITLNSDKTFNINANYGEGFVPITGTWQAVTYDDTDPPIAVKLTVTSQHQGWVVEDSYMLSAYPGKDVLYIQDGQIGIMLADTAFTYTGGGTSTAPSGNMSDWAVEEIKKAEELGLIPDSLLGPSVDYTKSITRAEFAGIAVKTYESLAHTTALPSLNNPFYDTTDLDVLKAYNCGIMVGVSGSSFEPYTLLNREQAATALTRVFKRATMNGWTFETDAYFPLSYTRPSSFADDADISSWAKDSVYFMVSNGIINGVGNNRFEPRAVTSAQEASGYATATREQALAIAVRMVENLG